MLTIWLAIEAIEDKKERDLVASLYIQYGKRVKAYAYTILRNNADAEDAMHETFFKVIRYREKFIDIDEDKTERLIVIYTRCACYDMIRKKEGIDVISVNNTVEGNDGEKMDIELPGDVNILYDILQLEKLNVLKDAIDSLKQPDRDIVVLKYYYDMKSHEIAELLKVNASTVRTKLQRSLERLKKILEDYIDDQNK